MANDSQSLFIVVRYRSDFFDVWFCFGILVHDDTINIFSLRSVEQIFLVPCFFSCFHLLKHLKLQYNIYINIYIYNIILGLEDSSSICFFMNPSKFFRSMSRPSNLNDLLKSGEPGIWQNPNLLKPKWENSTKTLKWTVGLFNKQGGSQAIFITHFKVKSFTPLSEIGISCYTFAWHGY